MALTSTPVPTLSMRFGRAIELVRLWLGGKPPAVQVAALPWRRMPSGQVEVLLATSRDTGRWVLPKGWPQKRRTLSQSAAEEAWEEVGMVGTMSEKAMGSYGYNKRLDNGFDRRVRVSVFPLRVTSQADNFPEKGQREMRWFSPEEAAQRVHEPELSALLRMISTADLSS
ncbi:hypothetical protein GCM10007285_24590 [Stappia taiwanensis]|nr:NUDIX hydrolase [Stappia taiwanensis]GGE95985.1 hypothetical protein GCM10007285_24590 [Stappia taiwanensis]